MFFTAKCLQVEARCYTNVHITIIFIIIMMMMMMMMMITVNNNWQDQQNSHSCSSKENECHTCVQSVSNTRPNEKVKKWIKHSSAKYVNIFTWEERKKIPQHEQTPQQPPSLLKELLGKQISTYIKHSQGQVAASHAFQIPNEKSRIFVSQTDVG